MGSGRKPASNGATQHANLNGVPRDPRGSLIMIGGHENKEGNRPILEELARRTGNGKLVVLTLASEVPGEQWEEYERVFRELGVKRVEQLDVRRREELLENPRLELLEDAKVLFFTGGDQMKITSKFGGTPLCSRMRELYERGVTIAGTSSGASVMSDTMMIAGEGQESPETEGSLRMAPGLGLLSGVIVDQHFAQRGRMGRLLGAVAQNPRLLGLGIDEDTAIVFDGDREFVVMGSGGVYVLDGREMTYTNAAEDSPQTLSIYNMKVHVLSAADKFDLVKREPCSIPREKLEEELASKR